MHAAPSDLRQGAVPVRYDYLDALRGWAFTGVLATHVVSVTGLGFAGAHAADAGKYGVQLFFMVSAFTIFLTLDRSWRSGRPVWEEFFIRRFFRILPMFWIGLLLYAFVPGRGQQYVALNFGPTDYLLTATLQHGWHPALINSLVPGGWSIAVEGTFYLLTPLCWRFIRSWQAALWLLLGSLVLSADLRDLLEVSYSESGFLAGIGGEMRNAFFNWWFPAQLPVFACGLVVYHVIKEADGRPVSRGTGAALLALSALILSAGIKIGRHGFFTESIVFAVAFVPMILGLKMCPVSLLVNPVTRFLGSISYSAYLLHFFVLWLSKWLLDQLLYPWDESPMSFLVLFGVTLAGTAGISWLTWRFLEQPCIRLGGRLIQRRRAAGSETYAAATGAPLASSGRG